jgi:hypothetical protein
MYVSLSGDAMSTLASLRDFWQKVQFSCWPTGMLIGFSLQPSSCPVNYAMVSRSTPVSSHRNRSYQSLPPLVVEVSGDEQWGNANRRLTPHADSQAAAPVDFIVW